MSAARSRSATPDKKPGRGNNDKLKNDMIDFLIKNKLGWDPVHANSVGSTFVNSVCDCLWYIDGNFQSLSCGVPDCFRGYNKPELHKKRKRDESILESTELFALSNSLYTLASMSYMKTQQWKSMYEAILHLANNLHKYATYLDKQNEKMHEHHEKHSCINQVNEWHFLQGKSDIAPGPSARYRTLHLELDKTEPYCPIFLNDHMPSDSRRKH